MSATPTIYTGENHSVNQTLLDLKYVRPNKEMGGYLAKLVGFWPMADYYFHLCICLIKNEPGKGAGAFMKPSKYYGLFIRYREKESYRNLNYSFED